MINGQLAYRAGHTPHKVGIKMFVLAVFAKICVKNGRIGEKVFFANFLIFFLILDFLEEFFKDKFDSLEFSRKKFAKTLLRHCVVVQIQRLRIAKSS
jgi:hypothetical protein